MSLKILLALALMASVQAQLYLSTAFLYQLADSVKTFSIYGDSQGRLPATTGVVYCDANATPATTASYTPVACSLINGMNLHIDGMSLGYSTTIKDKLTTKVDCSYQIYSTAQCIVTNYGKDAQGQTGVHTVNLGPFNINSYVAPVTLMFPSTGAYVSYYTAQTAALASITGNDSPAAATPAPLAGELPKSGNNNNTQTLVSSKTSAPSSTSASSQENGPMENSGHAVVAQAVIVVVSIPLVLMGLLVL